MNRIVGMILAATILSGCAKPTKVLNPFDEYYFDYSSSLSDLPDTVVDTSGSYTIIIERNTNRAFHEEIIAKAEACFPPEYQIIDPQDRDKLNIPSGESLWWGGSFDGVRIPFAITGSAVEYYTRLIQLYKEGKFEEAGTIENISASFTYKVSVTHYNGFVYDNHNYGRVHVVQQELSWSNYCGMLCALWFTRERLIIFDAKDSALLGVIGDGHGRIVVS